MISRLWQTVRPLAVCVAFAAACPADAVFAQGAAKPAAAKKPAAVQKTLQTKDGIDLHCTYFASTAGKEAPVVVMLHGKKGSRLVYNNSLAPILQNADYAVVTVDLRGNGETPLAAGVAAATGKKSDASALKPRDYQAMVVQDLEAVKRFLYDEHQKEQLNMNKLGIVAAEFSGPVALLFTEEDWKKVPYDDAPVPAARTPRGQDVKALVLLSPDANVPGLNANAAAAAVRNLAIPVLIGSGGKDSQEKNAAKKLHELLEPKKEGAEHIYYETYEAKFRGTDLLGKQLKVEAHIFNFLDKHLKKATSEWRDRRSRIDRE